MLIGYSVFAVVHHADVLAAKVGDPIGANLLALAILDIIAVIASISLILPNITLSGEDGSFFSLQQVFIGGVTFLPYAVFLSVQPSRHRQ